MHIFFHPDASAQTDIFHLDPEEAKHAVKVLRKKPGDKVWVVNGKGSWFEGEIIFADSKKCDIQIREVLEENKPSTNYFQIGIAPTKNFTRFEWFLEKSTELGVNEISPILCKRSERKVINLERSEKKLISALKQSQGLYLPAINPLIKYKEFVNSPFNGQKFIATITDETKPLDELYKKGENALVLVGPEGDFTAEEIDYAVSRDFMPVSLGKKRLRVETAGLIALHTLILKNE